MFNFAIRIGAEADIDSVCDIDKEASELFVRAGLDLDPLQAHELELAERSRWRMSLASGRALLALNCDGLAIGFAACATRDNEPYLDQLSVLPKFMRVGIGTSLLRATEEALRSAGAPALWLTTYAHLAWNRPFYERRGYSTVAERDCGPQMLRELDYERCWLPAPAQRVVMRKELP